MARKKTARKKKAVVRRKPAAKKKAARKAVARKKGTKKKSATKKTSPGRREISSPVSPRGRRGLGGAAGGQSGDTQGLSRRAYDDSESIEELLEEGQSMEAEAVSGVENAPDATREKYGRGSSLKTMFQKSTWIKTEGA